MKICIFLMIMSISVITYAEPPGGISASKVSIANIETRVSEPQEIEEADNHICPVDGNEIAPDNKAAYEYNGTLYNFCDPKCINNFMENPEEHIAKIEEQQ